MYKVVKEGGDVFGAVPSTQLVLDWKAVYPKWLDAKLTEPLEQGGKGLEPGTPAYTAWQRDLFNVRGAGFNCLGVLPHFYLGSC